jgi:hypothetical protein
MAMEKRHWLNGMDIERTGCTAKSCRQAMQEFKKGRKEVEIKKKNRFDDDVEFYVVGVTHVLFL